ncbi:MAG: tripartite tricarboxylate transporter substrate binding protein BugD [Burkholderiales bacterium]|nr:tripartite tricarboxylate transporter substrate binding protein BugD [Burkholderiales bacterium]
MKRLVAVAALTLVAATGAWAQNYPARSINLIVPFPPGGLTDVVGRAAAEGMQGHLGQGVVVENVTGGGGSIGLGRVVRAAPDGYTLIVGIWNTHVALAKLLKLDYDVVEDFAPVAFMADAPMLLTVHKSMPVNTFKELVSWLRANPDKASSASAGIGSPSHLLDEVLRKQTNTQFQTVFYRGAGVIMQDLMGGQVQLAYINPATAAPHVRSGVLRAVGVTSTQRLKIMPDVPTMAEAGFPGGLEFSLWAAIFAPKATPKEIIDTVNRAVVAALANPKVRERLMGQGVEIAAREKQAPAVLAALQRAEIRKWWPIIEAAGIKAQ